jgi:hypothetical protein
MFTPMKIEIEHEGSCLGATHGTVWLVTRQSLCRGRVAERTWVGVTPACGLVEISRSLYVYRSRRPACSGLRNRSCELAGEKRRFGYPRMLSSVGAIDILST